MKKSHLVGQTLLGLAIAAMLCAQSVRADQQISAAIKCPTHVTLDIDETGCLNHPGPTITIGGEIALGCVKARITLSNNDKGTHTTVVTAQFDIELQLSETPIVIPKQPVLGGVGGNPLVSIILTDAKGCPLTDEIPLGRCVQGLTLENEVLLEALLKLLLHTDFCSNHPGPYITLGGNATIGGLNAILILRNNEKGTHKAVEEFHNVVLILDDTPIVIPKQPVLGGAGGNPIVSIQLLQCDGKGAFTEYKTLGRCNKL